MDHDRLDWPRMQEVVLDTNVLVSGLRSRSGASHQLLRMLGQPEWRQNVSVFLALEYEAVLKRLDILGTREELAIDDFLDYLFQVSNLIPSVARRRPNLRDPGDEHILELAIHCRATVVTHNIADFDGADMFGVRVVSPAEFLNGLRVRPL